MEERYHRERGVALAEPYDVGRRDRERVEDCGPVRIKDPLRPSRRAARVAKDRRGAFVQRGVGEVVLLRREELFVVEKAFCVRLGALRFTDDDHVGDRRHLRSELAEQREERLVDDDGAVLGVPGDVGEVGRREANVERMEHGAHTRDRAVRFEVTGVVPTERRHAVPALHPELLERVRQLPGPCEDLAIRRAVDRPVPAA